MSNSKPPVTRAKDLRIGGRFGTTRSGDPVKIKAIHELCITQPTPHVHLQTSEGPACLTFNQPVRGLTA